MALPSRLLKDSAGAEVLGEVQTTPTANTVLARLKSLYDEGSYTTGTPTTVTVGATTTVALAANTNRIHALLINDSTETIYLKIGASAAMNQGIRLNAGGGNYSMSRREGNLNIGAINAICTSGSKILLVLEGV